MVCRIVEECFEPFATLEKCKKEIFVNGAKVGANAVSGRSRRLVMARLLGRMNLDLTTGS